MEISAILVNMNNDELCMKCARLMNQVTSPPEEILIISVSEPIAELKKFPELHKNMKLLNVDKKTGFAAAVNHGIKQSRHPLILLSHPNVIYDKMALMMLRQHALNNPRNGVIGPKVINKKGKRVNTARRFPTISGFFFQDRSYLTKKFPTNIYSHKYLNPIEDDSQTQFIDWVSSAACLIRKEVYEEVEGFDEDFYMFMEDIDFCWRVWLTDRYRVIYYPGALVQQNEKINDHNRKHIVKLKHRSIMKYINKFYSKSTFVLRGLGKFILGIREMVHTSKAKK